MFQTYCRNSLSYHHYPQHLLINIGTILRTYLCKISKEHYKNASRLRPKRRSLSRPRHESASMIARQHLPSLPVTITRRDQLKAMFCYRQTDGPEKEGRVALHKREKRFHNLTAIFAALKATNLGRWEIGSPDFGGSVAPRRCPHHSFCMCLLG